MFRLSLTQWLRRSLLAAELGLRYGFPKRAAASLTGLIAVIGLSLSVAVLIIVLSVINGFERELAERVFGVLPQASLHGRQPFPVDGDEMAALAAQPAIVGVAPFVQGAALAVSEDQVQDVWLTGLAPRRFRRVSTVQRFLDGGDLQRLQAGEFGVILGAGLAQRLGVALGDQIVLMLPMGSLTPAGLLPRQKRFTLVDLVRSGSELDHRAAFVHIGDAQRLLRLGDFVHGYQLKTTTLAGAGRAAEAGLALLGGERFYARTWRHTHGSLHHAIMAQKASMFVLLAFLVGVAAFNLISSLVMAVEQRAGDIAMLKTLGAETGPLVGSFVVQGALVGGLGVLFGALVGCALASALPALFAWVDDGLALDLMNQYFINYLPVDIRLGDLLRIAGLSFALCLVCTLYPAFRAARLPPSRVLAHE